jgi:hypothetical protein
MKLAGSCQGQEIMFLLTQKARRFIFRNELILCDLKEARLNISLFCHVLWQYIKHHGNCKRKGKYLNSIEKYHIFATCKRSLHMNDMNIDYSSSVSEIIYQNSPAR